jgi:hypothetical protein
MLPFNPPVRPVAGFDPTSARQPGSAAAPAAPSPVPLLRLVAAIPKIPPQIADVDRRGSRRLFLRAHERRRPLRRSAARHRLERISIVKSV